MKVQRTTSKKITALCALTAAFFTLGSAYAAEMKPITQEGMFVSTLTPFDSIEVQTSAADIDLQPGMAYGIEIMNNNSSPISYSLENGKLIIQQQSSSMFTRHTYVKIFYPADAQFSSVTLDSAAGDIEVEHGNIKTLAIATVSGDGDVDNVVSEKVEMKSVSGDLSADYLRTSASLTANNVSGDVELDGIFDGKTDITTVSGSVELDLNDLQSKYNLSLNSISGRITVNEQRVSGNINQPSAPNSVKIATTSGNIEVDFRR